MRFHVHGSSYQFKALHFGLSTAPMEFTVVAKEVKLMALQRGIRIHQYLDNWLVRVTSHQICLQHTQTLVALCRELGWLVNKEKSDSQYCPVRCACPAVHVRDRSTHSNSPPTTSPSPPRATTYEAHTVALEKQLEGPRITRKGDTSSQVAPPSLKMVTGGKQCSTRSTITPSKACSADLYRCVK